MLWSTIALGIVTLRSVLQSCVHFERDFVRASTVKTGHQLDQDEMVFLISLATFIILAYSTPNFVQTMGVSSINIRKTS